MGEVVELHEDVALLEPRGATRAPQELLRPVKSQPPTPTRAPDDQFIQMQDSLKYIRDTSRLKSLEVWVRGFPMPSVSFLCDGLPQLPLVHPGPAEVQALHLYIYIYIYV